MYTRNLVSERYSVLASSKPNTFLIIKPIGAVYETNPVNNSCTCAAGRLGRSCCHLAQLRDLVRSETGRMLTLSADTADFRHEVQLLHDVECLLAKWQEVKAATRKAPVVRTSSVVDVLACAP